MAKENNFTKAVKELLGEKENMDVEQAMPTATKSEPAPKQEAESVVDAIPSFAPPRSTGTNVINGIFGGSGNHHNPVRETPPANSTVRAVEAESMLPVKRAEPTYINKDTIVTGSITSKTDVKNEGQVTGDILTEENVCITGKVDGNVEGKSVQIIGGYVVGNITAKADIANDFASIIIGDITGENFSSDGKVKGNLKISNSVSLKSNAVICGNVASRKLSVQDGAVIKGNVQILSPKSTDDETFAVPKSRSPQSDEDDMFEIPKRQPLNTEEDTTFTMPQYHTPTSSTSDLLASLKNRMLEKDDETSGE